MNELKQMLSLLQDITAREWLEGLAFAALITVITIGALIIGG